MFESYYILRMKLWYVFKFDVYCFVIGCFFMYDGGFIKIFYNFLVKMLNFESVVFIKLIFFW